MKKKLAFLTVALASFGLGAFYNSGFESHKLNRTTASQVNDSFPHNVWVARKKDISAESKNEGWTSASLANNKFFSILIDGKEIFKASSNNMNFANDMRDDIVKAINQINDEFVVIDLSHRVLGEEAFRTFANPPDRVFSASKYLETKEAELAKIRAEIGK